jgi:hypothetical protein
VTHPWPHPNDVAAEAGWPDEAVALLGWAMWTAESLHYLADLDAKVTVADGQRHPWHVVDLAHARWAASSAVGAIDLCAAALARHCGAGPRTTRKGAERELDLGELAERAEKDALPQPAAAWAVATQADGDVAALVEVRHPTTHARLKRHFFRGGGGSDRTHLVVDDAGTTREVGDLVLLARDTATRVVEDFLDRIATGAL